MVLPIYSCSGTPGFLYGHQSLLPSIIHPAWQCPVQSNRLSAIVAEACNHTTTNGDSEIYPVIRNKPTQLFSVECALAADIREFLLLN